MPIARLAPTQPAVVRRDAVRQCDLLARRWPRAVRDVLVLSAAIDAHNRRAAAVGLAPIAVDPPLAAAAAMWGEIIGTLPEMRRARR